VAKHQDITGLILAGGEGRRVGGADKGLLPYQGRPLVAHVIERLAPQVDTLILSANRNLADYRAFGFPVVSDAAPERQGPLAGIAAGLRVCTTPWLVVCPCDCPTLPHNLVDRLTGSVACASLAVATVGGRMQPTFLLCRVGLLPVIDEFLAAGGRKIGQWCQEQGAIAVPFPDAEAFRNLNHLHDLKPHDPGYKTLGSH